jgi:hypothetical protein
VQKRAGAGKAPDFDEFARRTLAAQASRVLAEIDLALAGGGTGSEFSRQIAVDFEANADFNKRRSGPGHRQILLLIGG